MHWENRKRRWKAQYTDADGKMRHIGYFDTQEDAARAYNAAIRALPPDVQARRKTNSVVDGQLVPRARKTAGHGPCYAGDKRRRDEAAAPPSAPPRKRVSAPPAGHLLGYLDLAPLLRGDACLDAVAQP